MRPRRLFWAFWVLVLSFTTTGTHGGAPFSDNEVEIGRAAAREMEQQFGICNDAAANARVSNLAAMMIRVSKCPGEVRVRILNADEPNGVTLPGGFIFVTRGLLRMLPETDLLAAALAHEVAHLALGHMSDMVREQAEARTRPEMPADNNRRQVIEGSGAAAPQASKEARRATPDNIRQAREKAADRGAARYLRVASLDPYAMVRLLRRLAQCPELNAEGSPTHPSWPDRIRSIEGYLDSPEFRGGAETAGLGACGFPRVDAPPLR